MYIENACKSRRPSISLEKQSSIIVKIIIDYYGWKKSITKIARETKLSQSIVIHILIKFVHKKVKLI